MLKPIVKRQLASAWDVAFAWLVDEPHQHHPTLPLSVLLAMLTVALSWGWAYVAAVLALAWAVILRIGEVLQSFRSDLILPQDTASGVTYVLLKIMEPKTRGKHARHQAARVDQSDILHGFSMSAKIQSWSWAGAQKRQMAVDPCDGDLSPGGAGRNLREEVGAFSSSKTRKTCTELCWRPGGCRGLLEAWCANKNLALAAVWCNGAWCRRCWGWMAEIIWRWPETATLASLNPRLGWKRKSA